MSSKVLDKVSFWSLFIVIVFLPVFFFPFTHIPFETAKGFLLVLGLVTSVVFWGVARFAEGKISFPKSFTILSGLIFAGVFITSAFYSVAREVSFFGTMFDSGSAFFILATVFIMVMCAINIRNIKSAKTILLGLIMSSALLFVFQILHLFFADFLTLGLLTNKTDSIMGSWNALALYSSFFSVLALFIIEFFSIPKFAKMILGLFMLMAIFLVLVANFYLAWALLEAFALIIFIYKISFFYHKDKNREVKKYFPYFAFVTFIFALLFFISSQSIGGFLATKIKAANLETSPTISANFGIAKAVFAQKPVLGIGPNRFAQAWAMNKSQDINSSLFWNNYFDSGFGFLPTLLTTVGYVGAGSLLLFLFMFILSGIRAVSKSIKDGSNWDTVCFFMASLFLLTSSMFYSTGPVMFVLAMAFAGIFIGVSKNGNSKKEFAVVFSNNPKKSFFFLFVLIGIILSTAGLGFKYLERFASVPSFQSASLNLSSGDVAIPAIERALALHPNDLYYRTAAQIYFLKFSSLSAKGASITEEEKILMPNMLSKAITNAVAATNFDKNNYLNFQVLGAIYTSAGQLGVQDSFDKALESYKQASVLNPLNPGIKLAMAKASFALGNAKEAEDYTNEAIVLKPNFIDALIVMSQIKQSMGDKASAITYGEQALSYIENMLATFPGDEGFLGIQKDLTKYVSELKNTQATTDSSKDNKSKNTTKNN